MSKRNDFVGFVGYRKQREPSFVQPAPFTSSWNPLFSVLIVFCVIDPLIPDQPSIEKIKLDGLLPL